MQNISCFFLRHPVHHVRDTVPRRSAPPQAGCCLCGTADGVPVTGEPLLCRLPSLSTVLRVVRASSSSFSKSDIVEDVRSGAGYWGSSLLIAAYSY